MDFLQRAFPVNGMYRKYLMLPMTGLILIVNLLPHRYKPIGLTLLSALFIFVFVDMAVKEAMWRKAEKAHQKGTKGM